MAINDFGLSETGFTVKRLADILADSRSEAVRLFQDKVAVGDVVDTSDSAILGRLISLAAPGLAQLWQVAQAVESAFDPNSATGVALDNLVAYGRLKRKSQTYSTAQVILSGDNGTLVASGLTVGSTTDSSQWSLTSSVALSPSVATGITVTPLVVADNTVYTISYASISTSNTITYTSSTGATAASIVNGLLAVVNTSHPTLVSTLNGTMLTLTRVDEFSTVTFSSSANLGIIKVQKIGEVKSDLPGNVTADVNTLTKILTPQLGWDSVYNPFAASPGVNTETDEELRLRFRNTKFDNASNILEALYSALINLSGVQQVKIYENDSDVTDSLGVPSHSFMPIVLGGISSDIAEAIWENKPMGIKSFGDTSINIVDSQGFSHAIGFERPDPVPIYITMSLTTNSEFPASGPDDIKSDLISYFTSNFGVGDDVVYSRLYTPINDVPGHQVNSLFIGTSPNPTSTSNIDINFKQIATLDANNIIINI